MQHTAAHAWADFCFFADFGLYRRLLHVLSALCPLLLGLLVLNWMLGHFPLVVGDVASAGGLVAIAIVARRRVAA